MGVGRFSFKPNQSAGSVINLPIMANNDTGMQNKNKGGFNMARNTREARHMLQELERISRS